MDEKQAVYQEKTLRASNGLAILLLNIVLMIAAVAGIVVSAMQLATNGESGGMIALLVVCLFYWCLPCWLLFAGIKVLRPNEALVLTLFGKYVGTLKGAGIFFVNPFCTAVNPRRNPRSAWWPSRRTRRPRKTASCPPAVSPPASRAASACRSRP